MSPGWYRYQAVLVALAVNECLRERDGEFDPNWSTVLFKNLLGLHGQAIIAQSFAVDPLAFPRSVRIRLHTLATATGVPGWMSAPFRKNTSSAAVRTAKLISTIVHDRAAPPRTLWRFACEELGGIELPPAETVIEALETLTTALTGPGKREHKLRAITAFGSATPLMAKVWPALEPALVQPLLDWVPAVYGDPDHDGVRPGLMVPLMIDVSPGAKDDRIEDRIEIAGSLQESNEIKRSSAIALHASSALWRGRFSSAPAYRLAQVAAARVRLDLQLIEGIADALSLPDEAGERIVEVGSRLYLSGRSLELPIALAIYDRLVGSRFSGEIRASGMLIKFEPDKDQDKESGDTYLGFVEEETAKALAAEVQLADRFILPNGSDAPAADVSAVFARRLGAAVDFAFGPGGDGHRFVRAADVAVNFKLETYPVSAVVKVRDQLRVSGSVFQFTGPLSLMVQALFQISKSLGNTGFRSRGRYTFVRLSPTERADAAWATIWSALDGDALELENFIRASSDDERARIFAKQVSRNKPSFEDPRWSPHVLIIAGVGESGVSQGLAQGPYARFDIPRIMKAAGHILQAGNSPCDAKLRLRLGQTRIVLVQDDGMPRSNAPAPELEPELREVVEKLSAFRHGFTFAMARRQLGSPEEPLAVDACNHILLRLGALSYDGEPLLIAGATSRHRRNAAPNAFEFMLRWRCLPADRAQRQAIHERTAHSILPILHAARADAHVELATGLKAPWIDEAYAQLSNARSIAIERRDNNTKQRVTSNRLRLLRMSGTLVLERLPAMMGRSGRRSVYDDFVEWLKPTDHPSLHARAAAFATTLAIGEPTEAERKQLFDSALRHLEDGAEASTNLSDFRERQGAKFLIATERCRLAHEGRRQPDSVLKPFYRDIRNFVPLAVANLGQMREIYWGEWFARAGGTIENDSAARPVYVAGLWNDSLPYGGVNDATLIGWAGTLGERECIAPETLDRVRGHLSSGFWHRRAVNGNPTKGQPGTVSDRLHAGLKRLRAIQNAMDLAERGRSRRTAR